MMRRSRMVFGREVWLEDTEDGWVVAECPALPGCISQGCNDPEALLNVEEAMTGWLWAEGQKTSAGD